jgi:glycosyltransferase involved in cell wall biosynthesis
MELKGFEDFIFEAASKKEFESLSPKDVKFGVLTVTYRRPDGKTPKYLKETVQSLLDQKHDNWKLYLIGDDYENEEELAEILAMVPKNKLVYENLDLPGERLRFKGHDLWLSGSNGAANIALKKMKGDGIEWFARLDHDDYWKPDHLTNFAKAIGDNDNLKFMSSGSVVKRYKSGSDSYIRPVVMENGGVSYSPKNVNTLKDCWHSALCWNIKDLGNLQYRNVREQMLTEPVRDEPRGGDRDMIERLMMACKDKNYDWMLIPEKTVLYRNKKGQLPRVSKT